MSQLTLQLSRPVRARGLKHITNDPGGWQVKVAPRAGAWIETACSSDTSTRAWVAPRAGAWIETCGMT